MREESWSNSTHFDELQMRIRTSGVSVLSRPAFPPKYYLRPRINIIQTKCILPGGGGGGVFTFIGDRTVADIFFCPIFVWHVAISVGWKMRPQLYILVGLDLGWPGPR